MGDRPIPPDRSNADDRPRLTPRSGEVVAVDRPCVKCQYNTRGLPIGGVCPECGTPILAPADPSRAASGELPIDLAPRSYMKLLESGFLLLAIGGIGGIFVGVGFGFSQSTSLAPLALLGLCAALWSTGVLIVVRPRPRAAPLPSGQVEWKWLRRAAVATAVIEMISIPLVIGASFAVPGLLDVLEVFLMVSRLAALCTTAIYASFLADWASDTGLADRFRTMVWIVAASTVGVLLFWSITAAGPSGIHLFATIGLVFSVLGLIVGVLTMNIGWLQCMSMVSWAQRNAKAAMEREIRRAERRRREDERRLRNTQFVPDPTAARRVAEERSQAARVDFEARRPKEAPQPDDPRPGKDAYHIKANESLNPYQLED